MVIALASCASTAERLSLPKSTTADGRTVYGTLPAGRTERLTLTALPPVATYRWGVPGEHFTGMTAGAEGASAAQDLRELRLAATDALRLNGWREASEGELAAFEIAVSSIERSTEWLEKERDPRELLPDPRSCQNRPVAQRANCEEPLPRTYPPVPVLRKGVDTRVAFAIMRVSDNATAWWVVPTLADNERQTRELLNP